MWTLFDVEVSNSNMTNPSKFSILLPNKFDLINHIILDAHKTMLHDGKK